MPQRRLVNGDMECTYLLWPSCHAPMHDASTACKCGLARPITHSLYFRFQEDDVPLEEGEWVDIGTKEEARRIYI